MADSPTRQHFMIATGKAPMSGTFDVQPMSEHSAGGGYSGKTAGHLKDSARGAGKPVKHTRGKQPGQAAPDHGGY